MEKVPMGPPPPRRPATHPSDKAAAIAASEEKSQLQDVSDLPSSSSQSPSDPTTLSPSLPSHSSSHSTTLNPDPPLPSSTDDESATANIADDDTANTKLLDDPFSDAKASSSSSPSSSAVPYSIPTWSERPDQPFYLEVLKEGAIIDKLDVFSKGAYMFGRMDLCDFVFEHPTISRYHAVLQYRKGNGVFLYDLGSTHGTFINKKQVKKRVYIDVHVGDVIRFGQSSRLYIFQGPQELMPPEGDLNILRKKRLQEELQDCEASLLRAKVEASLADGISWGMSEDAVEDMTENDADELTWQTFKGQLTERQEKTRGKIIKRMEKVSNMRKEIDAIRAKDIAQGGLTQGQQTQIARNEQRIQQITEELDSLEETLNESIRESVGARAKKTVHAKKKGSFQEEDEDNLPSDDDEFYDRTKRKPSLRQLTEKQSVQSIETADTLLDKKHVIVKEMEEKTILLNTEISKAAASRETRAVDDALDAYMTDISSELANDSCRKIQEEISTLQRELDRVLYLLKIADPMGEAAQKRDAKSCSLNCQDKNDMFPVVSKMNTPKEKKSSASENTESSLHAQEKQTPEEHKDAPDKTPGKLENAFEKEPAKLVYMVTKPQWLGAVMDATSCENNQDEVASPAQGHDQFIDYKDRKKALASISNNHGDEDPASGLIIRKRNQDEYVVASKSAERESTLTSEVESKAEDAVALLLKHKRGYYAMEDELQNESMPGISVHQGKKKSKAKRVLGPEKPDYLSNQDYESWVPPDGQSGDGRTSLNEKLGY